jgi:two-component sensor histidine kinase
MKPTPHEAAFSPRLPPRDLDLLLRETTHRCNNDLQLVVSLLGLQGLRMKGEEARTALSDAAERVATLAHVRDAIVQQRSPDLASALAQVCAALRPYAEPRSIGIELQVDSSSLSVSAERIVTLSLVVNELMTNALKHAFEEGVSGHITVVLTRSAAGDAVITVDDDGLPYPSSTSQGSAGLGLSLVRRLMASIDGLLIVPTGAAKIFELRAPALDQGIAA